MQRILILVLIYASAAIHAYPEITKTKKAYLGLFGVVARSIKFTWPQIQAMLVMPLEQQGYQVDINVWNIDVADTLVDQQKLNNNDIQIIPYKELVSARQVDIDKVIAADCNAKNCTKWVHKGPYSTNALRQLYAEYKLGTMLSQQADTYDIAVVIGPDFYPLIPIQLNDFTVNDSIYTSIQGDYSGITNGFFVGEPKHVAKILMRYQDYIKPKGINYSENNSYEIILKEYFDYYKLDRDITNLVFCKMRANKICRWPGKGIHSQAVARLSTKQKQQVLKQSCILQKNYWLYSADMPENTVDIMLFIIKEKIRYSLNWFRCLWV